MLFKEMERLTSGDGITEYAKMLRGLIQSDEFFFFLKFTIVPLK